MSFTNVFVVANHVSAARGTIARLKKRLNQVEISQKLTRDLEADHATLREEMGKLVVDRDSFLHELGERLVEVASLKEDRGQARKCLADIAYFLASGITPAPSSLSPQDRKLP